MRMGGMSVFVHECTQAQESTMYILCHLNRWHRISNLHQRESEKDRYRERDLLWNPKYKTRTPP